MLPTAPRTVSNACIADEVKAVSNRCYAKPVLLVPASACVRSKQRPKYNSVAALRILCSAKFLCACPAARPQIPAYLLFAETAIHDETERCEAYLLPQTRRPLLARVEGALLKAHSATILEKGLQLHSLPLVRSAACARFLHVKHAAEFCDVAREASRVPYPCAVSRALMEMCRGMGAGVGGRQASERCYASSESMTYAASIRCLGVSASSRP